MYKRLKELRKKNGFTQEQVALFLKISRTGYNQYEIGKNDIPSEILIKLSNLYNTSIDYILEVTDITEPYEKNEDKKQTKEKIDFMRENFRKNVKYSIYYENYFEKYTSILKYSIIKKKIFKNVINQVKNSTYIHKTYKYYFSTRSKSSLFLSTFSILYNNCIFLSILRNFDFAQ